MTFTFTEATKDEARLRLALCGPAGSGKTYSALAIATTLGQRVAVIDTEHGAASKYGSGRPFKFQRLNLTTFAPATYVEAIHAAEDAGFDVIIIDSLSHAWMGKDGALEMVDRAAKKGSGGGNTFGAWRDVTPQHNALVEAMIACKAHLIVTMRVKVDFEQIKDDRGKTTVRKVGLAPVQRDGLEYEFDVVLDINADHEGIVSKTRCSELTDKVFARPGAEVAKILKGWLSDVGYEDPALNEFAGLVSNIAEKNAAPRLWIDWAKSFSETTKATAYRIITDRLGVLGVPDPRKWLNAAATNLRAQQPDNDPPNGTSGPRRPQSATGTDASGSAQEGQQSGGASVSMLPGVPEWAKTAGGIRAHLAGITALRHLENSVRDHGRALGAAYLEPAAERLIALDGPDAHGSYMAPTTAKGMVKAWAEAGPRPKAETRRAGGAR